MGVLRVCVEKVCWKDALFERCWRGVLEGVLIEGGVCRSGV